MAGKSAVFENDILKLIFWGTTIANIADNAAASPITTLYLSLHTADPTDSGNQASSEASYTGYGTTRIGLVRSASGWSISGSVVSPVATVNFPQCTGGAAQTITHVGIGTSGAVGASGKLLFSGALSPSILVQSGVTPQLTTATTITES